MPQDEDDTKHAGSAGTSGGAEECPGSQRLTNADFRRLLMTPRGAPTPAHHSHHSHNHVAQTPQTTSAVSTSETEDKGELRRKKKSYYAALKKQEDNKLAELAEKYRDRARERRDNANPDYTAEDPTANTSNAYRAVAPDIKSGLDAKERRRQMIQESKFLGGDMEHTHLVKGLDYALLQKVRSEIHSRELEQEQQLEQLASGYEKERERKEKDEEDEMQFKTALGKDVYKTLSIFRSKHVERNEMFAPGRMAYVIDLEDDGGAGETDIPTTLIRSRAEIPLANSGQPTLTTNDIVINKLAQVLSYLRHGARHNNKTRKNKDKSVKTAKVVDDSIYGEIGDYVPGRATSDKNNDKDRIRSKEEADKKKGSYFDKPLEKEKEEGNIVPGTRVRAANLLSRLAAEPEGYAECYPGLREMDDAIEDSDDEADYTKMDIGNKKGPIGRWDFDTQEEYSAYMNQREALPKAAFQYGVKTMDGRKTRKTNKEKNDKAELDREWQQIQNIIQKRKGPKDKINDEPDFKVPKY